MSIDFMNREGIATAILSLSTPGLRFIRDPAEARSMSRSVNDYAAHLHNQHPSRFGFFAALPSLHDTAACLEELAYAFDVLHADGVALLTSYEGKYLGDSGFKPIWDALHAREAVVFIHPTMNLAEGQLTDPWIAPPLIDFPHETTRTAVHLILSNTIRDHPKCKIILSHGGGTLPYIATRVAYLNADGHFSDKSAQEFMQEARGFWFDLALSAYEEEPIELLLGFAGRGKVLYGSDFPFDPEVNSGRQVKFLEGRAKMRGEGGDLEMRRGNAEVLFPRFGGK